MTDAGPLPVFDAGWGTPVDGGVAFSGPTVPGTVTIARGTAMGNLGPGFAGFSYEKSHMTDGFFTGSNAPLIAMYNLLGPGVMRISANDVNKTSWVASAMPVAGGTISPSVGTADVDGLAAFLSATSWKVIYGVRGSGRSVASVVATEISEAVAEATYVAGHVGSHLASFEIGNEPNFYTKPDANNVPAVGGSWAAFRPQWEAFVSAIQAAVPGAPFSGPGVFSAAGSATTGYASQFATDEASKIVLLAQHYYIAGAGAGSLTDIVSAKPAVVSMSQGLSTAVTTNHIRDGFRWTEMNSYAHHGQPGVSDALASAFWGIDFMLTTAQYGSSGVNFHGGGNGMDGTNPFTYEPIKETASKVVAAQPLFYGMLLVSRAGVGPMHPTTVAAGGANFTAYAITPADGSTNVVMVNKDTANGVNASVDVGAAVTSASAVYLQGPSIAATSGVTFAGAGISANGAWSANPPYALPVHGNVVSVLVPPASAVIVHAR